MAKTESTKKQDKHSPNDKRAIVKNNNNIAFEKDRINRIKQADKKR